MALVGVAGHALENNSIDGQVRRNVFLLARFIGKLQRLSLSDFMRGCNEAKLWCDNLLYISGLTRRYKGGQPRPRMWGLSSTEVVSCHFV